MSFIVWIPKNNWERNNEPSHVDWKWTWAQFSQEGAAWGKQHDPFFHGSDDGNVSLPELKLLNGLSLDTTWAHIFRSKCVVRRPPGRSDQPGSHGLEAVNLLDGQKNKRARQHVRNNQLLVLVVDTKVSSRREIFTHNRRCPGNSIVAPNFAERPTGNVNLVTHHFDSIRSAHSAGNNPKLIFRIGHKIPGKKITHE